MSNEPISSILGTFFQLKQFDNRSPDENLVPVTNAYYLLGREPFGTIATPVNGGPPFTVCLEKGLTVLDNSARVIDGWTNRLVIVAFQSIGYPYVSLSASTGRRRRNQTSFSHCVKCTDGRANI